jgi:hypothetical protein
LRPLGLGILFYTMSRPELAQARAFIQRATELGLVDPAPSDARVALLADLAFSGVKVVGELTEGYLEPRIESFRGTCFNLLGSPIREMEASLHIAEVDREHKGPLYITWVDVHPRPVYICGFSRHMPDAWEEPYVLVPVTVPIGQHRWHLFFPSTANRILIVLFARLSANGNLGAQTDSRFEVAPGPEARRFREWLDSHVLL